MDIALDVFPADVSAGPMTWSPARVMVIRGTLYVFAHGSDDITAVLGVALTEEVGATPFPFTLQTATGPVTVTRAPGCGCGHPLKRASRVRLLDLVGEPAIA